MSKQKAANGLGSLAQKSISLMSCGEGPEHRIIFMELLASVIKNLKSSIGIFFLAIG